MTNKINNNQKKINVSNNNNNNNNLFEFTYLLETLMLIKVINKLLRFVDIDECSTRDSLPCDANADCINTFGSYNCTCRIGYSGNGTTCTGQYTAFTRLNAAQKKSVFYQIAAPYHSEVVGERENGRGEGDTRGVSFSRARFLLCPLLPSACYAGYMT